MQSRVEGVAGGPEGFDADPPEARAQLGSHESYAVEQKGILREPSGPAL